MKAATSPSPGARRIAAGTRKTATPLMAVSDRDCGTWHHFTA